VVTRYRDSYLVARATDGFGRLIKGIGIAASILSIACGVVFMAETKDPRSGDTTFTAGAGMIAFGVFGGALFYLPEVLVSAEGQILKASLDGAVNGSPFLTDEQKATVMSLPAE
jgi:hypothetical protein